MHSAGSTDSLARNGRGRRVKGEDLLPQEGGRPRGCCGGWCAAWVVGCVGSVPSVGAGGDHFSEVGGGAWVRCPGWGCRRLPRKSGRASPPTEGTDASRWGEGPGSALRPFCRVRAGWDPYPGSVVLACGRKSGQAQSMVTGGACGADVASESLPVTSSRMGIIANALLLALSASNKASTTVFTAFWSQSVTSTPHQSEAGGVGWER